MALFAVGILATVFMVVPGWSNASTLSPEAEAEAAVGSYVSDLGLGVTHPSAVLSANALVDPSQATKIEDANSAESQALTKAFGLVGGTITSVNEIVLGETVTQTGPVTFQVQASVAVGVQWTDGVTSRTSGEIVSHTFDVVITPTGPRITGDSFQDDLLGVSSGDPSGSRSNLQEMSAPIATDGGTNPTPLASPDLGLQDVYNGVGAAWYTQMYVYHFNSDGNNVPGGDGPNDDSAYNHAFRDYNTSGGDCANFASQAMNYGGLQETSAWSYTPSGQKDSNGFDTGTGTPDWYNAYNLEQFVISDDGQVVQPSAAQVGDLIYDTWDPTTHSGDAKHVEILVDLTSNDGMLMTCHNEDAYQFPVLWYNSSGSSYAYSTFVQPVQWAPAS